MTLRRECEGGVREPNGMGVRPKLKRFGWRGVLFAQVKHRENVATDTEGKPRRGADPKKSMSSVILHLARRVATGMVEEIQEFPRFDGQGSESGKMRDHRSGLFVGGPTPLEGDCRWGTLLRVGWSFRWS